MKSKAVVSAVCLFLATAGALFACGAGNQTTTHDGTTVTLQKPADSATAPAPSK